uniref:ATP-grasp domain-containing protein n=1 Tax=Eubacterium cellulosolvens TaxID=29322 RepID=UPI0006876DA2|nr:ATP-grasp domain-containing protein [[Eubacterium] cellulosolvens]
MKRKIMILGAGIYQVPLILKANEMGLHTIVVSYRGNYPGFALADEVCYLDTTDSAAVLKEAERLQIDGIATTGTDVAIQTLGLVCDSLQLRGISAGAASVLTDKLAMKEMFLKGGVPSTVFRGVHSYEAALDAARRIGFPVMMKACDVSGSRGITMVHREEELRPAFEASAAASHTTHYIVEKVAAGTEIGLDAFVYKGKVRLCLPHRKEVCHAGNITIPAGHAFPFRCSPLLLERLETALQKIVDTSGADNCAINCDIMIDGDELHILEAGGRCGATGIPELIRLHTGIDYYETILRCALGDPCTFTPTASDPCMSRLLFSPVSGNIVSVDEEKIREIAAASGAEISLDYGVGDHLPQVHDGTDRVGQIILHTDDRSTASRIAGEVLSCIRLN